MIRKYILHVPLAAVLASFSSQLIAADTAREQLNRAPRQSGNVTFDGSRSSGTSTSSSTVTAPPQQRSRTPEQAIQDYRNSSRTTPEQQRAIENYKNSGKSRSGR